MFLRNVGYYNSHMASHPRRWHSSLSSVIHFRSASARWQNINAHLIIWGWVEVEAWSSLKGKLLKWIVSRCIQALAQAQAQAQAQARWIWGWRTDPWLACESRSASKCNFCVTYPPSTCYVTSELYDTCLVPSSYILHYRRRSQCDKLPFMKFTTCCPLNPILDAPKINPLTCKTCNAIRNAHCRQHFGQFVTAVRRTNRRLYVPTLPPTVGEETRSYLLVLWQLFLPLHFLYFISWLWNWVPRETRHRRARTEYEINVQSLGGSSHTSSQRVSSMRRVKCPSVQSSGIEH
jgi:hypothetical protein